MSKEQALHIAELEEKISRVVKEIEDWYFRGKNGVICLDTIAEILNIELSDK
ncbi:hypothetical protein ACF3NG_06905 [Aerococcaceae bacterium WGS1372]